MGRSFEKKRAIIKVIAAIPPIPVWGKKKN